MNGRLSPSLLMAQVTGTLLHAGYQYDDGLVIDLYGDEPTEDDGYNVQSIAVSGTTVEIGQLFRNSQLLNIGHWLDLKDGDAVQREWAERYKHHAAAYKD